MSTASSTEESTFSTRLHELRTAELRRLPGDARTVLHGGASAGWYFRWFEEAFPGTVERHVGIEAFSEAPVDLPPNVQWLRRTLGDMAPVADGSIDMVFAGQVIEHLWAEDVAAFLLESHRVLRPGGLIVMDSPNRSMTEAIRWRQPEHTVEFSVDEVRSMLSFAGFEIEELRGVLLTHDRDTHTLLALEDERMDWEQRARLGAERPEDSFVWWVVARRSERNCDEAALYELAGRVMDQFRARRLGDPTVSLPMTRARDIAPHVSAPAGFSGLLLHGPSFPLESGTWEAAVLLRRDDPGAATELPVASVSVVSQGGERHARRDVHLDDLNRWGRWTPVSLGFGLAEMAMGIDVQVDVHGPAAISARAEVTLERPDEVPVPDARTIDRIGIPEPRTLEVARMLARRTVSKALGALRH